MAGLLIEDVTLTKKEQITAHVRFRGGATITLTLPLPLNCWQVRTTPLAALQQIDALLCEHTDSQTAQLLDERGHTTGAGASFTSDAVRWLRQAHRIPSLKQRLRAAGWLNTSEYAALLGVHPATVKTSLTRGLIRGRVCNDRGEWLFDPNQSLPPPLKPGRTSTSQPISPPPHVNSVA